MSNSHAKIRRIVGVTVRNDEVSEKVSEEHSSLLESSGTIHPLGASLQVAGSNQDPVKEPTSEVVTIKPEVTRCVRKGKVREKKRNGECETGGGDLPSSADE